MFQDRRVCAVGFPMGRDSATFWDQGTEVPSLSRDKRTTGKAQNLAKGRYGTACQNLGWDAGRDGTITMGGKWVKKFAKFEAT